MQELLKRKIWMFVSWVSIYRPSLQSKGRKGRTLSWRRIFRSSRISKKSSSRRWTKTPNQALINFPIGQTSRLPYKARIRFQGYSLGRQMSQKLHWSLFRKKVKALQRLARMGSLRSKGRMSKRSLTTQCPSSNWNEIQVLIENLAL